MHFGTLNGYLSTLMLYPERRVWCWVDESMVVDLLRIINILLRVNKTHKARWIERLNSQTRALKQKHEIERMHTWKRENSQAESVRQWAKVLREKSGYLKTLWGLDEFTCQLSFHVGVQGIMFLLVVIGGTEKLQEADTTDESFRFGLNEWSSSQFRSLSCSVIRF